MTREVGAAEPTERSSDFDAWFDEFQEAVLRRHPVDATFLGEHRYDHLLSDYSREADADWVARIETLMRALDSIPVERLSEAQLYDRILARGALQLWKWETTSPFFQSGNPAHHTCEAIAAALSLYPDIGSATEEQVVAGVERLRAVPAFLATARQRMRAAPLSWTELAIRQADASAASLGRGFSQIVGQSGIDRPDLLQAATVAAAAFDEHAAWLRSVLSEQRIAAQPAGPEALDRYLHVGHLLPAAQTSPWWFDFAHAELAEATLELRDLAKAIDWRATSRTLLKRLASDHPTAETYSTAFAGAWDRCRTTVEETGLLTWPVEPVRFLPVPRPVAPLWQDVPFPVYRPSPPLAPRDMPRAYYPALDVSLPDEEQARLLGQMNNARILLEVVVRHAGLGNHVQSIRAREASTRIGRLAGTWGATRRLFFCGNAVTDGWASYAAELMEEVGALTPLQRLSEAQRRLRVAARAVGDIGMHTGELSMMRVARIYRDEAGMPASMAMQLAVRDSMHPGVGMAELVGAAAIDELRRTLEDREGARFDLQAFHDRFLSYGAIPVTLTAASMLDAG